MARNTEIERKFLVSSDAFLSQAVDSLVITQGYLCKEPDKTIRVRIRDARAFLTIKSNALRKGLAKFEWEKEIDVRDAQEMLLLCLPGIIRKTRYIVPAPDYNGQKRCWEVDVFHERLEGLILAEIELGDENEPVTLPEWIGEEVTGLPEYYNANM
jgi:CYTH domain-containing protein